MAVTARIARDRARGAKTVGRLSATVRARANIQTITPKTIKPHTRMEHIEVQTPDGPAWMLVKRHYDASNISGSVYGLDWWSTPEPPKKSRLRRVLDALLTSS